MFGYRTFYFLGLLALLISDRILGLEHTMSLPTCLMGLISLVAAAVRSQRQHHSPLPAFYISLSVIGYASWWMGGLNGRMDKQNYEWIGGRYKSDFERDEWMEGWVIGDERVY